MFPIKCIIIVYQVLPDAVGLLDCLRESGVVLGAVTNSDPRIDNILKDYKLRHYFEFILDAYTAVDYKPNPAIFAQAFELSGLPNLENSEVLHIGDSVQKDYIAAKNLGCSALLIATDSKEQCRECGVSYDESSMFQDLPSLITNLNTFFPGRGDTV